MATQNIYSMVDTWNAGGTTFTAIKMNVTDTASASGSLLLDLQVGGSSKFSVRKDGLLVAPYAAFTTTVSTPTFTTGSNALTAGFIFGASNDLILARDAADTLAQRNGTNAQAFRVYNTYTDASNYERGVFDWTTTANTLTIGTTSGGTGIGRRLLLTGAGDMVLSTNGSQRWAIDGNGRFLALTDNALDIGASGANRPRNVFIGSALTVGTNITMGTSNQLSAAGGATLSSPADGIWRMTNNANTDFSRLQFGGTTSSFPSLKRNGAELQCRLADDSALADFTAKGIDAGTTLRALERVHAHYATAIPAGGTTGAGVRVSSTANFGMFFGSGAPTLSAAKGSLYLRSDGTTTNDRMYVNTDGATTWTAVTTAA